MSRSFRLVSFLLLLLLLAASVQAGAVSSAAGDASLPMPQRAETPQPHPLGDIFRKDAPTLIGPEYIGQLNAGLVAEFKAGIGALRGVDGDFLRQEGWVVLLQVLLVPLVAWVVVGYRKGGRQIREWTFVLRHPWATGLFLSVAVTGLLYGEPPALWRLLQWFLATGAAMVLAASIFGSRRQRLAISLVAGLFLFSLVLKSIAFPQPLHRLFLLLASLGGIPVLLQLARGYRAARGGRSDGFSLALQAGAALLGAAVLTQLAGLSSLSVHLVESSTATVFLLFLAATVTRIGQGGIEYFLAQEAFARRPFFSSCGAGLVQRLKGVFRVAVALAVLLLLLETWGLYDSMASAWRHLSGLGVAVGNNFITVGVLVWSAAILYGTVLASWILRSLLECEIFPQRQVDRGVRDSIKRLLHYFLILLGVLFTFSIAGFEMRNLAILGGALGIGIGFGLQNIVNNFVSGLILLFERPVKVGDTVVLGSDWGKVTKIGLRSTTIETFDRAEIIVPNSSLISERVTNWTLTHTQARLVIPVGVAYGSDVPKVLQILQEEASCHPDVLQEPAPSPVFTAFGDSSLNFELRVWLADVAKRVGTRSDLLQAIDARFRREEIEIPFPQRDLHLRSADPQLLRAAQSRVAEREAGRTETVRSQPGSASAP